MKEDFEARIARIQAKHGATQPPLPLADMDSGHSSESTASFDSPRGLVAPPVRSGSNMVARVLMVCAAIVMIPLLAGGGLLAYAHYSLPEDAKNALISDLQTMWELGQPSAERDQLLIGMTTGTISEERALEIAKDDPLLSKDIEWSNGIKAVKVAPKD